MNTWNELNLPDESRTTIGFWVLPYENVLIRNFFISKNQCFVVSHDGDWKPHPLPDYWKYFDDEPDWMGE